MWISFYSIGSPSCMENYFELRCNSNLKQLNRNKQDLEVYIYDNWKGNNLLN